jgi:hypothetical protein
MGGGSRGGASPGWGKAAGLDGIVPELLKKAGSGHGYGGGSGVTV